MVRVEELRQNDPERTRIRIWLHDERSDADLAQALEQNPFVTEIEIGLHGVQQQAHWNSLLGVIATRANLEEVTLQDAFNPEQRTAPVGLVHAILRAIQQNTTIQSVELKWFPDAYNTAILEGLRSNISVKSFIFSPGSTTNISDATSHALQQLLVSTTSIQRFELRLVAFTDEQPFRPIAQGIINSECVAELKLSDCLFHDGDNFAQLQSILQEKRNLTSLCLHDCRFGGGQVREAILSFLSRPDSPLRCFEFLSNRSLEAVFPGVQFKDLLQAIQMSKLERLKIGSVETPHQLQTLTQSIPLMKLKELEINFWDDEGSYDEDDEEGEFSRETIRQDLLHAVKNNFSLRAVKAEVFTQYDGSDLFESTEDKHSLAFYANRNELLDQWVDNPVTVEQKKVWPDALGLAERAGPNAFFRGMRSVLQSDYGNLSGRRKRKRPQIYAPS